MLSALCKWKLCCQVNIFLSCHYLHDRWQEGLCDMLIPLFVNVAEHDGYKYLSTVKSLPLPIKEIVSICLSWEEGGFFFNLPPPAPPPKQMLPSKTKEPSVYHNWRSQFIHLNPCTILLLKRWTPSKWTLYRVNYYNNAEDTTQLFMTSNFIGSLLDTAVSCLGRRVASYTQIRTCVLEVTRNFWNLKQLFLFLTFYLYATKTSLWKHHFD